MLKLITILNKVCLENITVKLLIRINFYFDSIIKNKMKSYFVDPLLHTAAKNWDRQLGRFRFGSA